MPVQYRKLTCTLLVFCATLLLVTACGTQPAPPPEEAAEAPADATATSAPATAAPTSEPTSAPPTETAVPPTAATTATTEAAETAVPATATSVPATAVPTSVPATATLAPTATPEPNLHQGAAQGFLDDGTPALGSPEAPVLFYDYSDFLCPTCQTYVLTVEPEIIANYVISGQVRLAFRPILNHGERSLRTSEAAMCAAQQEQFWPMHDLLFERLNQVWATGEGDLIPLMQTYAAELGLDQEAFAACQAEGVALQQVIDWDAEQRTRGITLQPTFEINEQRLVGLQAPGVFQQAIESQLP